MFHRSPLYSQNLIMIKYKTCNCTGQAVSVTVQVTDTMQGEVCLTTCHISLFFYRYLNWKKQYCYWNIIKLIHTQMNESWLNSPLRDTDTSTISCSIYVVLWFKSTPEIVRLPFFDHSWIDCLCDALHDADPTFSWITEQITYQHVEGKTRWDEGSSSGAHPYA